MTKLTAVHWQVITDARTAGSSGAKGGGANTLSGGEKSFSQICLLLSLWESIPGTIRCLDEFDVFMDSVNRTMSMKLLTSEAVGTTGMQYMFITPQDMAALKELRAGQLKVVRLPDPVRDGQQRLPFTQTQG